MNENTSDYVLSDTTWAPDTKDVADVPAHPSSSQTEHDIATSGGGPDHNDAEPGLSADRQPPMSATRVQMLQQFGAWLDRMLVEEPPPTGIDPEILAASKQVSRNRIGAGDDRHCDLFSLWSAMTVLTQEVKLQGRTFKQLRETLAPVDGWGTKLAALDQSQSQVAEMVHDLAGEVRASVEAAEKARAESRLHGSVLDVLLDLHARFTRGLESCQISLPQVQQSAGSSFWRRLLGPRPQMDRARLAVEGLQQGYALTLQRLTEALDQQGISPIQCLGQPFDPQTMVAVDIVQRDAEVEGTVLEVYQPGFRCNDQLLRPAKVKVAGRAQTRVTDTQKDPEQDKEMSP